MNKFILLFLGGGLGTTFRYFVYLMFDNKTSFPLASLIVNSTGSFLIGFLWGLFEYYKISQNYRIFIFVGLLGGFTTFSTFAFETFNLFKSGNINIAFLNILLNNFISIILAYIGYSITVKFFN